LTGAGDTFAAALVTELAKGTELRAVAVSAAFFAALKIRGVGRGSGIDAIPTLEEVTQFVEANPQRVQCFLEQEHTPGISLFDLNGDKGGDRGSFRCDLLFLSQPRPDDRVHLGTPS
jgi:hypothetical protein